MAVEPERAFNFNPSMVAEASDSSLSREQWLNASPKFTIRNLMVRYGDNEAIQGIDMTVREKQVTALIGPSGCGKSTFLRSLNRMNDLIDECRVDGEVFLDGEDLYASDVDVVQLRKRVGMVFQRPNPFPMSVFDNVAYGPRLHGRHSRQELSAIVEESLRRAALWDEVHDRLDAPALGLSGGQQQRLCIARALAVDPEVLLMDEPTASLDPVSASRIEDLIRELSHDYTIIIVTHNMQQAARVSDATAFFLNGRVIEYNITSKLFTSPEEERTEQYITGRFG